MSRILLGLDVLSVICLKDSETGISLELGSPPWISKTLHLKLLEDACVYLF